MRKLLVSLVVLAFAIAGAPIPGTMQGRPFLGASARARKTHVFAARDR